MTADIELLPLPKHPGGERLGAKWNDGDMYFHARAVAEHNVKERDAEIEALREDRDSFQQQAEHNLLLVERLAEALRELVALGHPRDPAIISARAALRDYDQEGKDG